MLIVYLSEGCRPLRNNLDLPDNMLSCKVILQCISRRNFTQMRTISTLITIVVIFLLSILVTSAQQSRLIAYDEVLTGELDSQVYEQFYTFEGQAEETILIQMRATSEDPRLDSYLFLRDSEGNELAFDDDAGGNLNSLIGPYTLEESGVYTVVATRFMQAEGTSTGEYELSVVPADYEDVQTGDTVRVELDAVNNVAFYAFTTESAGLYEIRYGIVSGNAGTDLAIRNPQGDYITSISVDPNVPSNFTVMNLYAGARVNVVARSYTAYDQQGQPMEDEPVTVEFSLEYFQAELLNVETDQVQEISSTLADRESVDYYRFNAVVGQTLSIEGETDEGNIEVYVILPDGGMSFYGGTTYSENNMLVPPQIITQTGEFVLVVHRNIMPADVDDNSAVSYTLNQLLKETPRLEAGVAVEGTIDIARGLYESAHLYEGRSGETITIHLSNVDDYYQPSFSMEVAPQDMSADGQTSFYTNFSSSNAGSIQYDVRLPRDATYIIRIYDGFHQAEEQAGTYRLMLESN